MFIGGGHSDVPMIVSSRKLGYRVITSGRNSNSVAHEYSDEYKYFEDYCDYNAVFELVEQVGPDAIIPCADDLAAITCAKVAENLQIPGHDSYPAALLLHTKSEFRKLQYQLNLPTPKFIQLEDRNGAKDYLNQSKETVLIKPVDCSGGKGISRCTANEDITSISKKVEVAFNASKSKKVVVEEFINGSKHGASTFIESGKVIFLVTDDERYDYEEYAVSSAFIPSSVSESVEADLRRSVEAIAGHLNLADGLFHLQFVIKGTTPYIIEVMRRTPGDLYVELVDHLTENRYSESIVKYFSGQCVNSISKTPRKCILRQCVYSEQSGIFTGIDYSKPLKRHLVRNFALTKTDSTISTVSPIKHAIALFQFKDSQEMYDMIGEMESMIRVKIENE
jgi:formate-dependent phosphoribosylglycinamide formyltransferase (GAR transformylase)